MSSVYYLYSDGGARGNPGPAATGFVIKDDGRQNIAQAGNYLGEATNNEAEYRAVLAALEHLIDHFKPAPGTKVLCHLDSQLVVEQLSGRFKIKKIHLAQLASAVHRLISQAGLVVTFTYIPREQNAEADALVNQTLDSR